MCLRYQESGGAARYRRAFSLSSSWGSPPSPRPPFLLMAEDTCSHTPGKMRTDFSRPIRVLPGFSGKQICSLQSHPGRQFEFDCKANWPSKRVLKCLHLMKSPNYRTWSHSSRFYPSNIYLLFEQVVNSIFLRSFYAKFIKELGC